ncbi:MAG TPA: SNF2-related protein [Bacillota bacterium]|nr:SNF2-related protein [Bacillota bacterium]
MDSIHIHNDLHFIDEFQQTLDKGGPFSPWNLFEMAYEAERTTIPTQFGGLLSLKYLPHMEFLPHQIQVAEQVIEEMHGRAILADEVGLGKTIEAGLILKEYMIRGLVKKALILVPASLVNQWARELNEKFYIPTVIHRKNYSWEAYDIMISSIDTAKRSPHREQILNLEYDFVLIDEAHKLKNHRTKNYSFARELQKKFCLLLTATPIQNDLIEIFNLVSILKPGHLGNYESFIKRYGKDRNQIRKDDYLKQLVQKVMVRHTRKSTRMNEVKRNIETIWVNFTAEEMDFYQILEKTIQSLSTFTKITLLREICSSREACYLSLKTLMEDDHQMNSIIQPLIEQIEQLPHHTKAKKVIELIKEIDQEKVIIFTQYRATQHYLQWYLQQYGISSVPFQGGFNRGKKDWMQQLFKEHAQVLIATEAGSEGINLQFCKYMINYDLPWNPMKLEQRIGRIHRYGQTKDIHVFNFAIRQTLEEHIMKLLYEKINLFEHVIGELDDILAELNINNMETEIQRIFTTSTTPGEVKVKLNNLSSVIKNTHHYSQHKEQHDAYY